MTIGQRIQRRREELGMTQEELAHRIGYKSKSSINKIELDIQQLKQAKIKEIADALHTTPDYIMGWEEEIKEEPKPSITFTDEELRILKAYRSASDDTKNAVAAVLGVKRDASTASSGAKAI